MVRLIIDGSPLEVAEGALLIDTPPAAGKAVPHVYHDKHLVSSGACRLCLVKVGGQRRQVANYTAEVAEGMVMQTRSHALDTLCRTSLELTAACYPWTVYAANPKYSFHRPLAEYGVPPGGKHENGFFKDDSYPYLSVGMERCVHCGRCVRTCEEVQGQFIWETIGRNNTMRIAIGKGPMLLMVGCVSCSAHVDSCASGALFDKRSGVKPTAWTRTTCIYCAVGYQMEVGTADGRIVPVRPAGSPVNRGHFCLKGQYALEYNHAPDRVTQPMLRRNGGWQAVGWNEALGFTTSRLQDIIATNGADTIGVLGSSWATDEENYLAQRFARVVLYTHNVDCCARVYYTPSAKALKMMLGIGTTTNTFDNIEHASAFLIYGTNPTENYPVVGAHIKQAVLRGAQLVVIDPRCTELATLADMHLPVYAGSNVLLFNTLATVIIEEGWVDHTFLFERVIGFGAFAVHVTHYAPESVAERCGVSAPAIHAAAGIYAKGQSAMCFHGLGVAEHLQGSEAMMTFINLAPLTSSLGRSGSGINPLRGQNNI